MFIVWQRTLWKFIGHPSFRTSKVQGAETSSISCDAWPSRVQDRVPLHILVFFGDHLHWHLPRCLPSCKCHVYMTRHPGRSRARSTRYTSPRWIGLRTRRHSSGLYGRKTSAEVPQVELEPFVYGWKLILYCHMFGGININPSCCNSGFHLCAIWFWLSLRFIPVSQQCFPGTICRNHDLCSVNMNDSWDWWMCITPSLRVSKLLTHPQMDKKNKNISHISHISRISHISQCMYVSMSVCMHACMYAM